jgi:L-rhamnose mutarotase
MLSPPPFFLGIRLMGFPQRATATGPAPRGPGERRLDRFWLRGDGRGPADVPSLERSNKNERAAKMKRTILFGILILAGFLAAEAVRRPEPVKRVGMVIGIKPEHIEEYKRLHADSNPGVRDLLRKYNIHNFSIFLQEIDGKWYEFAYYEYTGGDYEGDMAALAREPRNIDWLKVCDPMQIPLPGSDGWTVMEEVYFNR